MSTSSPDILHLEIEVADSFSVVPGASDQIPKERLRRGASRPDLEEEMRRLAVRRLQMSNGKS